MSHVAVRIVADWLEHATYGVNAQVADVPLLSGDADPASLTIYDETQDKWVSRRRVPDAADATASISFPCVICVLSDLTFGGGAGTVSDSGVIAEGTATVLIQVYNRDEDTANGIRDVMYWQRAIRGSLSLLENAAETNRTQLNTRIMRSQAIRQPPIPPELGDLVLLGSTLYTATVWESTPATF